MSRLVDAVWINRNPVGAILICLAAIVLGIGVLALGYLAIAGIIGAVAFVIFLRYPAVGLFLTTALLLLSGISGVIGAGGINAGVPVTVAKLCGVAAFTAWLANRIARQRAYPLTWETVLVLAFFVWALIGILLSPERSELFGCWVQLATLVAFFIMTVDILFTSGDTRTYIRAYIIFLAICGGLSSFTAIAQYILPNIGIAQGAEQFSMQKIGAAVADVESLQGEAAVRVSGRALHSNWLALLILTILPTNAYWFSICKTNRGKVLVLLLLAINLFALLLTFTRTGLLIGSMVLILATAKHLIRLSPLRVCALGLAMVMAWLILPEPYKERVLSPKQYTSSTSVQVRAGLQEASFRYMTEKPLWGLGLGGFGYRLIQESTPTGIQMKMLHEMYDWRPVFMGEHNLYLQIGCETGMIGLILFLTLAALIIHRLFVSERRFREMGDAEGVAMVGALQISVFAFLLSGIFLHALQQRIWWMAAPTAVALCMYATTMWERHSTNKTASSRN